MSLRPWQVSDTVWRRLVPTLAPLGGRRAWGLLALALALGAGLALWPLPLGLLSAIPAGDGDALSRLAVVLEGGLGWEGLVQVDRTNHPVGEDLVARFGVPIEAAPAIPLVALLGWPLGVNLALWGWVWLAGLSAAWLGGCWWGDHRAALTAGIGWQLGGVLAAAGSAGAMPVFAAMALWPLAVGLWLRALDRGTWVAGVLAGLPVVALAVGPREAFWWWVLAALPPLGIGLASGRHRSVLRAMAGVVVVVAVLGLGPLSWTLGAGWLFADPPDLVPGMVGLLVLLLLAAVAFVALRLHRTPRRWVLPACWTVLGLLVALGTVGNQGPAVLFGDLPGAGSPGGGLAVAELGLLLVATGLAAWRGGGVLVLIVLLALNGSARDLPLTPWPPAIPGGQGAVLHLPLPVAGDSTLVLAAGHGRPLASGAGTDDPVSRTLFRIAPVLTRLAHLDETGGEVPENAELAQLRRLGVRELLVDLDRAGPWGAVLEQRLGPGVRDQQWLRLELPR